MMLIFVCELFYIQYSNLKKKYSIEEYLYQISIKSNRTGHWIFIIDFNSIMDRIHYYLYQTGHG